MSIRQSIPPLLCALNLLACSSSPTDGSSLGGQPGGGAQNGTTTGAEAGTSAAKGGATQLDVSPGDSSGGSDVMNGKCDQQDFNLTQQPAEILIVLDRSGSMKDAPSGTKGDSKWNLVVPGVTEVVTTTNSTVSWGLKLFPEGEGSKCIAASVTDAIPVPIMAGAAPAISTEIMNTTPEGNGTPTGDAIRAAVTYLKTLTDPNPKYILLATDGEPSCANQVEDAKEARRDAVQAVTDAASSGFKTFVVGVATTKDTATQALNDMAVAGQMPRASTDSTATKYYLASTKDELVHALEDITGQAASCAFQLSGSPPDPSNIAVKINGMNAPRDTTHQNGWDYADSTSKAITVFGSWCDQIQTASVKTVNFILGCPGQKLN